MNNLRRFPPPWIVEEASDAFRVYDANRMLIAVILHREDLHARDFKFAHNALTRDEARRIALGISRLPELMRRPQY